MANPLVVLGDAYRAATSKAARRTLVYGALLVAASSVLYGLAVVGYLGFYHDYVPHQVRTAPVHLQYGWASTAGTAGTASTADAAAALLPQFLRGPHHHHRHRPGSVHPPFALTDLRGLALKTDQAYDVDVVLTVPRSPANEGLGNFMVELALASRGGRNGGGSGSGSGSGGGGNNDDGTTLDITAAARLPPANARDFLAADGKRVLFAAARPGLLPYRDPLLARLARLVLLPYHLLAPAAAERARLVVPMAESLSFGGGGSSSSTDAVLPAVLYLEVRAGGGGDHSGSDGAQHELQTYAAEVVFVARLRGLRWFMYHHRIIAFALLTTAFWLVEVFCMVAVFVLQGLAFGGSGAVSGDDGKGDGGSNRSSSSSSSSGSAGAPLPLPIKAEEEEDEEEEKEEDVEATIKKENDDDDDDNDNVASGGRSAQLASIPAAVAAAASSGLTPVETGGYEEDVEDQDDEGGDGDNKDNSNSGNMNDQDWGEGVRDDDDDDDDDDDGGNDEPTFKEAGEPTAVATGRSPSAASAEAESSVRQRGPRDVKTEPASSA
ncbi:tubulin-tyrosine ligase [Niveomyces insectorum RCEF 264]|uniref:Tubulin-tyrosine ligase n=1 Tax=Niveomyces insectorum RCEF 264 TaxID=1081102 RepID=A0A167ZVX4_9HYPO|nr:tubulin-tyrosine ligase [Niveomyces insectorum RCEF 264]